MINGEEGASRTDYNPSEDDNVTVTGVEGTKGGLGYFGFSYFEENADKLKAVEIDGGDGCVAPASTTASGRHLHPAVPPAVHLRRQVGHGASPRSRPSSSYYVNNDCRRSPRRRCSCPLNDEQIATAKQELAALSS